MREGGGETRVRAGLVHGWDGKERRVNTDNPWLKEDRRINKAVDRRMKEAVYHLMEDAAYADIMAKYQEK